MEVIVGKLAGFCFGVNTAVTKAEEIVKENKEVYCIGEIVHNKQVVENLEALGMKTVEEVKDVPDGKVAIFRSHGMPEEAYKEAEKKNLKIYDLTCPSVKLLHEKALKHRDKFFIILVGKIGHAENVGTISYAGDNSFILEDEEDILECYQKYEESGLKDVYVLFQTTYSTVKAKKVIEELKHEFYETDVIIDNTICSATEQRQKEVKDIAQKVDKMIIVGGKHSSNTLKLVQISKEFCDIVYHVETKEELEKSMFENNDKIGIMAGASTPKINIEEVKEFLEENL